MPQAPRQHRPPGWKPPVRSHEQRRGSASERGYGWTWTKNQPNRIKMAAADSGRGFCRYCDVNPVQTMDHAIPPKALYAEGTAAYWDLFRNERLLIPACMRCNTLKGSKLPRELPMEMRRAMEAELRMNATEEDFVFLRSLGLFSV